MTAFQRVDEARQDVPLTYFEFTTLAALECFRRQGPDLVVLEVGLGGRLDAVNLVDADVAVVTSIGLDHTDWLGDTREAIAMEKCGIGRAGRPLLYGEVDRPATVDASSARLAAPLFAAGRDFGAADGGEILWRADGQDRRIHCSTVPLGHDNLATALQALSLVNLCPALELIESVAAGTRLAGRSQVVMDAGVRWLFDVAHNQEAIARLLERLPRQGGTMRVLVGMLQDKPARQALAMLAAVAHEYHLVSLPPPRGQSAEALRAVLPDAAGPVLCYESAEQASTQLSLASQAGDTVLVLGSFLTVDAVARARGWDLFELAGSGTGIKGLKRTQ